MDMNRLLRYLVRRGLISSSAKIIKLSNQGLSGEVYSLDSEGDHFILKFYRDRNEKKIAKIMHIYRYLSDSGVPVPEVYIADIKGRVSGRPFLLMQKLKGEKFSSLLKKGKGKDFVKALASSLHKLHSVDVEKLDVDVPNKR